MFRRVPPRNQGRADCGDCSSVILKGGIVVKLTVRDRESIQEAVRRFRKLVERSGTGRNRAS